MRSADHRAGSRIRSTGSQARRRAPGGRGHGPDGYQAGGDGVSKPWMAQMRRCSPRSPALLAWVGRGSRSRARAIGTAYENPDKAGGIIELVRDAVGMPRRHAIQIICRFALRQHQRMSGSAQWCVPGSPRACVRGERVAAPFGRNICVIGRPSDADSLLVFSLEAST